MNNAQMLVNGLNLELPEKLRQYICDDVDTTCCVTGECIHAGIPWKRVIPPSTGEYLDLMHGMAFEYMSIAAATAYKGSWNLGSRLIFEDGAMYHPYIAAASADKSERTYWSALVRDIWPRCRGQRCLCIMAGDYKKRVWPRAQTGELGKNTPVFLLDPDRFVSQNTIMNWERLIGILDFVEDVYTAGFSKSAIENGLYSNYAAFSQNAALVLEWEDRLVRLRKLSEFAVSILIAQKNGGRNK